MPGVVSLYDVGPIYRRGRNLHSNALSISIIGEELPQRTQKREGCSIRRVLGSTDGRCSEERAGDRSAIVGCTENLIM
jgi:hypothetical protein